MLYIIVKALSEAILLFPSTSLTQIADEHSLEVLDISLKSSHSSQRHQFQLDFCTSFVSL